jgi:multidrug efflux pump subunit AcrA (membrane-fusion protein)
MTIETPGKVTADPNPTEPTPKVEHTGKVEKVRGMNASLSGATGGTALTERAPMRHHITRRQMAFGAILVVAAIIATVLTVDAATSGDASFPAVVTASKVYDLNFPNTGTVSAIMVTSGQHVNPGQILATQEDSSLKTQLTADQAAVNADQAVVAQDSAPQLTTSQRQQDLLSVQQAQTALSNAQGGLSSAQATAQANVGAAQAAVKDAQSLLSSDSAIYAQACPNGPVAPSADLTGSELQAAQSQYMHCQSLQQKEAQDQNALSQAQAQVPVVEAQGQGAINTAQASVNSAQAALNTANYQQTAQGSPADATAQAQAQATLNQAEAQLAQVQQEVRDASIIAPDGGIVTQVYGQVGETLGPNGVHQYQAPAALPSNQPSGFSLFPSAPSSQGQGNGGSTSSGNQPVIELISGRQQVKAQVPESSVSDLPVGKTTTITFSAINESASGVVTQVDLNPTRDNSAVTYNVVITLTRALPGLLPGMTATVRT